MSRQWHCTRCGHEAETDDTVVSHFHVCAAPARRQVTPLRTRDEDRQAWARRMLGAALEASLAEKMGAEVLLRHIDTEEEE